MCVEKVTQQHYRCAQLTAERLTDQHYTLFTKVAIEITDFLKGCYWHNILTTVLLVCVRVCVCVDWCKWV